MTFEKILQMNVGKPPIIMVEVFRRDGERRHLKLSEIDWSLRDRGDDILEWKIIDAWPAA